MTGLTVESTTNGDKTFNVIHGTTSTKVHFYCDTLPLYTLFHVARYSDQLNRKRIFTDDNTGSCGVHRNWFSGFWGGYAGVAFHGQAAYGAQDCQWLTPQTDVHHIDWVVSSDTSSTYRSNGVTRGSTSCTQPLQSLGINCIDPINNEYSDFMVVDVIIIKEELALSQIQAIENALMIKYGLIGNEEQ